MRPYRRKFSNFLIDRQFQTKYLLVTILLLLAYTFIFVMLLFLPYLLTLAFDYPLDEQAEAARILLILHNRVWPAIGTVIVVLGALSIFVTHKIAGPLHRIKQALTEIAGGNLETTVKLRKWDDLQEMAQHVNLLAEELHAVVTTLKDDHERHSAHIDELEGQIRARTLSEASGRELIDRVQASRRKIAETLDRFKLRR